MHAELNMTDADEQDGLMLSISWKTSESSLMLMTIDEQVVLQVAGRTTPPTFAQTPIVFVPEHGAYAFRDGDDKIPPLFNDLGCNLMVMRPTLPSGPLLLTIANESENPKKIQIDILRMNAQRQAFIPRMKEAQKVLCEMEKAIQKINGRLEKKVAETEEIRTELSMDLTRTMKRKKKSQKITTNSWMSVGWLMLRKFIE